MQGNDESGWVERGVEILRRIKKHKAAKWFIGEDTGERSTFGLSAIQQRLEDGIYSTPHVFSKDMKKALSGEAALHDASDVDKISAASEKLLGIFESFWGEEDGQQSEYSEEVESDSGSDSQSEAEGRDARHRRGVGKRGRRTSDRSDRPQRTGRVNSQRTSVVSAADDMDSALDVQHAMKILNRLIRSKHSWPFLEPVDPVALELEDYFEIITSPMDLGTVKERLTSGQYSTRSEFEREVRLVFSNAMQYNNEGDEIWSAAQALVDLFDSAWCPHAALASTARDDDDAQMGRAPTVRKPGKRKTMQPLTPRGENRGDDSVVLAAAEVRGKGREARTGSPRDYTKAVQDGGWRAAALEVMTLITEHENAWPFMGAGPNDSQSAPSGTTRRLDLCSIVERLQDGAYARGGRKDFLRDVRSVLVGAVSDEGDSRRGVMARELSALFETEWTAVSRAVDSEPPRRPVPTAAAADVEMEDARQDEESVAAGGDGWRRECADALRRWGRKQSALMLAESKQDSGARSSVLDAAAQALELISTKLEQKIYVIAAEFVADIRALLQKTAPRISDSAATACDGSEASDYALKSAPFQEIEEELKALESKWSATTSGLTSHNGPPMVKRELPWRAAAEKVMVKVMNLKDAWPFLEPVDSSIAPDYLDIISCPMDLGTVKKNLVSDYYRLPSDWIKDVHLVFDNAEQYNAEEDAIFKLALRIRSSFEHALNGFLTSTFPPLQQLLTDLANDIIKETWQDLPSWLLECRLILRQLLFHPCAWPFLRCNTVSGRRASGIRKRKQKQRVPAAFLVELTSIKWLLECGYYASAESFLRELRSVIVSVGKDAEPLTKELLPIIEQSCIYLELFQADRSLLGKASKGKKRPILEVVSDFQVADIDWEVDCLVLMEEILQAPNSWPFRNCLAVKGRRCLKDIRARLQGRVYSNALEWATDVRRLLSSFLPESEDSDAGSVLPRLGSASTGGGRMVDDEARADEEYTDSGEYIALEDETPRTIALKLSVSADQIVSLNKSTYSGLHLNAKLHKGTVLQLPPRLPVDQPPQPIAPPTDNSNVQIRTDAIVSTAATALLASFDARLRSQIASGGRVNGAANASQEKGEVVVRYRKAQRFFHTKPDRRMAGICKTLEEMIKDPNAWPLVEMSEYTENPGFASCNHTMSLSIIKATLELGAYATPEEVAADIRLVLETAISFAGPGSKLQQVARNLFTKLAEGAANSSSAQQPGVTSVEALSLKSPANMKNVRALLERMMKRPANSVFMEPVDPEDDGCEDYLDIIQEPMDLGTIKDYLDGGAFETIADFAEHVRLMFKNALTYNPDGSAVHRIATESQQVFEADLAALISAADSARSAPTAKERRPTDMPAEDEGEQGVDTMEPEEEPPQPTVPEALFRELELCRHMPMKWWHGYDEHCPLPSDWEAILDMTTQRTYYWHRPTKNVTWEQPAPPSTSQAAAASRRAATSDGRGAAIEIVKSDQRVPWMRREGEYFCPIMCCWRSTETVNTPLVSRLNDPAAVVTAQRRRALLQPILQQALAPRGQGNAIRISVGGTQYQAYVPANMSMGQIAVFQQGMAQARPNASALPATNSQTLQNMQLQFQQQMNALVLQQQQQQQQALHYGGQTNTILAVQQNQNQQWAIQAAAQQHGVQTGTGGDPLAFRRIGPSGTLSGAGQTGSMPNSGLFPGSAAALAVAAGSRTTLDARSNLM